MVEVVADGPLLLFVQVVAVVGAVRARGLGLGGTVEPAGGGGGDAGEGCGGQLHECGRQVRERPPQLEERAPGHLLLGHGLGARAPGCVLPLPLFYSPSHTHPVK